MSPPLVLAYHGLGRVEPGQDPDGLMVPVESFRDQVARVRKRGYRIVPQRELDSRLAAGGRVDGLCVLTFDDAPRDNATTLLTQLDELDLHATVYACPALTGELWWSFNPELDMRLSTVEELQTIARHPRVRIGGHTRSHTPLDEVDGEAAFEEMTACRRDLERMLEVDVSTFAYPNCGYSEACPDAARRAGNTSAVTCGGRGARDAPYEMLRVSPAPNDGAFIFDLKCSSFVHSVRDVPPVRAARRVVRTVRARRLEH